MPGFYVFSRVSFFTCFILYSPQNTVSSHVDDSSPDGSDEVIRANLRPGIDEFIITDEHCGPSCTKYQGFKHLLSKKLANANDIVIILDADDYFMTDQASKRILQEYTSGEAWITYGSFEGKWAEQVRAVTEEEFKDVRKSTWVYGHPRSFKVGLTKFLYSAFKNVVQSAEIWSFPKKTV